MSLFAATLADLGAGSTEAGVVLTTCGQRVLIDLELGCGHAGECPWPNTLNFPSQGRRESSIGAWGASPNVLWVSGPNLGIGL